MARRTSTWLQNAALGILALSGLEILDVCLGRRPLGHDAARPQRAAAYVLAGVLAGAYAWLVPRRDWGARSGLAFAQLPVVMALARAPGKAGGGPDALHNAAELALWGATTGVLMRALGAHPEAVPGSRHAGETLRVAS